VQYSISIYSNHNHLLFSIHNIHVDTLCCVGDETWRRILTGTSLCASCAHCANISFFWPCEVLSILGLGIATLLQQMLRNFVTVACSQHRVFQWFVSESCCYYCQSVQQRATGCTADESGFYSQRGQKIFLFSAASRLALGSPNRLYNEYQGLFSWG
jgi:hypothetical protein